MKISSNPPQHLSNLEVLNHFLELKQDNDQLRRDINSQTDRKIARARADVRLYSDRGVEWPQSPELSEKEEARESVSDRRGISEELVWVQNEILRYLCSTYVPTSRQTEDGVAELADKLQDYGLTKGEVLQLCNLAPITRVELHAIIEEVEVRFQPDPEEAMNHIAHNVIAPTLLDSVPRHLAQFVTQPLSESAAAIMQADGMALDEEAEGFMNQEYVHEAEWGPDREGGVDDEPAGEEF